MEPLYGSKNAVRLVEVLGSYETGAGECAARIGRKAAEGDQSLVRQHAWKLRYGRGGEGGFAIVVHIESQDGVLAKRRGCNECSVFAWSETCCVWKQLPLYAGPCTYIHCARAVETALMTRYMCTRPEYHRAHARARVACVISCQQLTPC